MNFTSLPTNDNSYCVYLHKRKTDGVVFYIGSGVHNKREFHFSSRSKAWHATRDEYGVEVEVYAGNLSKLAARDLEEVLIISGDYPEIVNTSKVCKSYKSFKVEDLCGLVKYDEESPTCLSWTEKQSKQRIKRTSAGCLDFDKNGKPKGGSVMVNRFLRQINRVVWVLHNGYIEEDLVVDHIDGNRHNNKISNLRAITIAENSRNRAMQENKTNKDLPSGVYENESNFISQIDIAGNSKSISFAKVKYGYEEAKQKAIAWRSKMISKLNELGANYSDRHFQQIEAGVDFAHKSCAYTGVSNTSVKRNKAGVIQTYQAHFMYDGEWYEKSYSVSKYGEDEARRLAIDFATKGAYTKDDTITNTSLRIEVFDSDGRFLANFNSAVEVSDYLGLPARKVYKNLSGEVKKKLRNKQGEEVTLKRIAREQTVNPPS